MFVFALAIALPNTQSYLHFILHLLVGILGTCTGRGHAALYMWCSEGQLAPPQAYIVTCLASFKVTFKQASVKTGFLPGMSNFTAGSSCS